MKILILSCDTGQGHNSAARAVEEAAGRRSIPCCLANPLSFGGKKSARLAADVYNNIIRVAPRAFGVIYKAGDLYSSTRLTSPVYYVNRLYADKLKAYILENNYTAVVCTHLYAMEALTALQSDPEFTVPCYGVLTDYTCIPFFAETRLTGYFIPHTDLTAEMIEKGLPAERLHSTGIPVSARFAQHIEQKAAREQLGLPQDQPVLLIMSGGVGCGNLVELCEQLRQTADAFTACVLTGSNQKIRERIDTRFAGDSRIHTVPFTRDVNIYMNAADVMISKPGGLTSTEAAVANVPLVHQLAFSGCEAKNVAFFTAHGLSVQADSCRSAVENAWALIRDPARAAEMRRRQHDCIAPDAADRIISEIVNQ